jgi:nitroreductase
MKKPAITSVNIHPVLAERWSPRSLDNQATIPTEDLTGLMEAARWAPSASNAQPWRFIVARRGDENFKKIKETLVGFNQAWSPSAAAYIVVVANMKNDDGTDRPISLFDSGLATAHLSFEAHHRGYVVHQMAGFDSDVLASTFGLPSSQEAVVVLAIGKQAPAEALGDGPVLEREIAPRERITLEDLIISGSI